MMQKLKVLKSQLGWIESLNGTKQSKKAAFNLRQRMWATIGLYKYGFSLNSLRQVALKHMEIGHLPTGYMYPELNTKDKVPKVLRSVMIRKW